MILSRAHAKELQATRQSWMKRDTFEVCLSLVFHQASPVLSTPSSVVGRIKDIIIRGGEVVDLSSPDLDLLNLAFLQNLFPVQIENVLTSHPMIREAAVVAVPDARYGEAVGVWVVREEGSTSGQPSGQEVREWVAERMNPQVRN